MVFKPNEAQKATAKIVWGIIRGFGYSEIATASILGNLQVESYMNPGQSEFGGAGYGLIQWTPKENLYTQGVQLGISREECETAEGQAKIIAQGDKTGQWMTTSDPRYGSQVVNPLMLEEYKKFDNMQKAVENFVSHFTRPRLDVANVSERVEDGKAYYELFTGSPPTEGGGKDNKTQGLSIWLDNYM